MAISVVMPKMGLTMEEGTVVKWHKSQGDSIEKGELLLEIVTDKATMEVMAPESGILARIIVENGHKVKVGTTIGLIALPGEKIEEVASLDAAPAAGQQEEAAPDSGEPTVKEDGAAAADREDSDWVKASPAARRQAKEQGIDLAAVKGSGPGGRIIKADISAFSAGDSKAKASPTAWAIARSEGVDLTSVPGSGVHGKVMKDDLARRAALPVQDDGSGDEVQPFAGMRKIIAERMSYSAFTAPHVTLAREVDVSALEELKNRLKDALPDVRGISYTVLIACIVARTLREFPQINSSLDESGVHQFRKVNLGIAVALNEGLVVPVINDAASLGVEEMAAQSQDLIARAGDGKLMPDELQGGTFTISNLGGYRIDVFTPIINQPESAILGLGRIGKKPVVVDEQIVIRPMMFLSLSIDHRVIDGVPAALFLDRICQMIQEPLLLLR